MNFDDFWKNLVCESQDKTKPLCVKTEYPIPSNNSVDKSNNIPIVYEPKRVSLSNINNNHCSYFKCSKYELSLFFENESGLEDCFVFSYMMVQTLWGESVGVSNDLLETKLYEICKGSWENIPNRHTQDNKPCNYDSKRLSDDCSYLVLGLLDLFRYFDDGKREL